MAAKGVKGGEVLEGLKTVYQDVAALALAPDAGQYMQVIQGLQQIVLKAVDAISQAKAQQASQMQAAARQQANGPTMGGMGAPNPMQQGMGGAPGGPPRPPGGGISTPPNPDELRRVLAASGAMG